MIKQGGFSIIRISALVLATCTVLSLFGQRRGKTKDFITELRPTYKLAKADYTTQEIEQDENTVDVNYESSMTDSLQWYADSMKIRYCETGTAKPAHSVLAYNGTNQEKALEVRRRVLRQFPDAPVNNDYIAPNWKVKVGPLVNKLEAVRIKESLLKKGIRNVLIIPDRKIYKVCN